MTVLELAFDKKSLRSLCESEDIAQRVLGANIAKKLKARLADLRAATSVNDLVAGSPQELTKIPRRQLAISLGADAHIVICANHSSVPLLNSRRVDWSKVSRVKILGIENDQN